MQWHLLFPESGQAPGGSPPHIAFLCSHKGSLPPHLPHIDPPSGVWSPQEEQGIQEAHQPPTALVIG